MKSIVLAILLMMMTSCAHHVSQHKKGVTFVHHHHSGRGNCTTCLPSVEATYDGLSLASIPADDLHHAEVREYELYYRGMFYYFTSKEKLSAFEEAMGKKR